MNPVRLCAREVAGRRDRISFYSITKAGLSR